MMDWTTRHCRYFHRLLSPHAVLYTEMVTTGALIHGEAARFLRYDEAEHPVICQLGGSDPRDLASCAKMVEDFGYDGVNLNCGCPSDRVQSGRFGACLMASPELVAECVDAMQNAVNIPVSVKCRIGIDDQDSEEFLHKFVSTIAATGCKDFTIHARKAWLQGLSPKQNREVPPLDYPRIHRLKAAMPELCITLNGGIRTLAQIHEHGAELNGIMIGREAYQNPYFLAEIEQDLYGTPLPERRDIAQQMIAYAARQIRDHDVPVKAVTRHIIGLFHEQRGAKKWRQALSTLPYQDGADEQVIAQALEQIKN